MPKMHPVAEAALRAVGKAGKKALERAAIEAATTAADSLLEDVEQRTGGLSDKAREARQKIQDRKEETMARKRKKRAAEEVDEEELAEEEEEEEEEEDDAEEESGPNVMLLDAEVFIRNAVYILEAATEEGDVPKKLLRDLEDVHEKLNDLLDEADG